MDHILENMELGMENLKVESEFKLHNYRAEQLTTEVWNYIFFGGDLPKDSGISEEALL